MLHESKRHLDAAGQSYFAHMRTALSIARRLSSAALACLLHAFFPGVFRTSASRCVFELHASFAAKHPGSHSSNLRIEELCA